MKLWIYGLIAAALVAGVVGYGHTRFKAGEAKVQAVLDEQRQTWNHAFAKRAAITVAKDAATAARNKELDDAWNAKLAAATSAVDGLSARLRRATLRASGCTVPGDTAAAGTPADSTVPGGDESLERLLDGAWRAAAFDSAALTDVMARYNNLRPSP